MFKAPLIENKFYYNVRAHIYVLGVITSIVFGLLQFIFDVQWSFLVLMPFVIWLMWKEWKLGKMLNFYKGSGKIEIDLNAILVYGKNKNLLYEFHPERVERIELEGDLNIYEDKLANIFDENKDKLFAQSIKITNLNQVYQFYFEIESHYMIIQLKKILDHWKTQQVKVEYNKKEYNQG